MPLSLDQRIDAVSNELQSIGRLVAEDENARKKVLGIVTKAVADFETPVETVWKMIMSPHAPSALMVLIRMGVVAKLAEAKQPMKAKDLAIVSGAAELLIIRMMRPLVALGVFTETEPHTYTSTPISEVLTTPPLLGGYQFM
ncbi:uncharacterized protein TRUGW13939_07574 [Talaromyces rugulosus]|uniref:O-methyltransferase dimerisation domain-containing protein n=1 Tax=Talaromyces rugulosus TaxID=121627 RepID=A0A7H8R234_TALRU|nr:uncharacterized protein TRUGW13939_07574 [Talaromyces rugulosus]QKX60429.1 hypothetical protein TRUGW13939_07574 [Talaromyces rugulosus]